MKQFKLLDHQIIGEALAMMDSQHLAAAKCWFGGGTAIVLKLGEYRLSRDVDFLCADADGYRELRSAAVERGVRAFFPEPVEQIRDFQIDQYGLRTVVGLKDQIIRFEVVREGRISLQGHLDKELGVPTLVPADMLSEKLLANADRCHDRSTAFRDAIDLGMLIKAFGEMPEAAIEKTRAAYGADIERKVAWAVNTLRRRDELHHAADALGMAYEIAAEAISALRIEALRVWPNAGVENAGLA